MRHLSSILIFFSLFLSMSTHAATLTPLNATEMDAVLAEIKAMVKIDVSQVDKFQVREATPERIERLYNTPAFLQQPTVIRENGLLFAGQGSLLNFDKPSDIEAKMSRWFAAEFAKARAEQQRGSPTPFFQFMHLYGPYPSWKSEAAAFITLWNCMPHIVWVKPEQSPFAWRRSDSLPFMAIADRSSGTSDFGTCVHERSGYHGHVRTDAELAALKNDIRKTGNQIEPVLRAKFAHHLAINRCRGTGPDDCVLILLLWSSLSPADTELAKSIRMLEDEVAPAGALPPLHKAIDAYERGGQESEANIDAALRKAAFLNAKLHSVIFAESAWPADALSVTLRQISQLYRLSEANRNFRWSDRYDFSRGTDVYPWQALNKVAGKNPRVQAAVLTEMERLASSCDDLEPWLKLRSEWRSILALRHFNDPSPSNCIGPDWNELKTATSGELLQHRNQYLSLLGKASGNMHEKLLSEFTDTGNACFGSEAIPEWQRALCKTWIAEPQTVTITLPHHRLSLNDDNQFHAVPLPLDQNTQGKVQADAEWLIRLTQDMDAAAKQTMQAFIDILKLRKGSINTATWWSHPRHDKALLELRLYINDSPTQPTWPYSGSHMLFVFSGKSLSAVGVPYRFTGNNDENLVAYVSDLDGDGNLEVWWSESPHQCRGDSSDLERSIDCGVKKAEMGEIRGDALTYFVASLTKEKPSHAPVTPPAIAALIAKYTTANVFGVEKNLCNIVLIGSILEGKLDINFSPQMQDGNVITAVCKPHPVNARHIIVSAFYELNDSPNNADGDGKKGFLLAVVDVEQRKLISQYRTTISEDATTRISGSGLQIDTARYYLAPGTRALGVRMHIGYSPRCAEGGESNYLWLFVEDGTRLRPVIESLPMSLWKIVSGQNNCGMGEAEYTIDNVELTLSIAPTVTNGWHDLEVVAQHFSEVPGGVPETNAKPRANKQVIGILKAKTGKYNFDTPVPLWQRVWPER